MADHMPDNALMADEKRKDRHKPSRMVRIKERLARQLDHLVERNESSVTSEVNRALRELLEREKLWPPSEEE
jgi:hypothetical protein